MWKQFAISGVVGAAILGTGAVALAETGSPSPSPIAASSSSSSPTVPAGTAKGDRLKRLALRLKAFEHAEWVANDGTADTTHDAVKGAVAAVSATSITVKAADGFSATFVVDSTTAVRVKGTAGKAAIGAVKVNDTVLVAGVKSGSTVTAKHVLDAGAK